MKPNIISLQAEPTEEATTSQGSGVVNPEPWPVPHPRPTYHRAYTLGTAPPPSPFTCLNFNFPPMFSMHPTVPTFSAPPPTLNFPAPPPTQQFLPFPPTSYIPTFNSNNNVQGSRPTASYPPYLQPNLSSQESTPKLVPSASSAHPPSWTAAPLSMQKLDKGKKRTCAPATCNPALGLHPSG